MLINRHDTLKKDSDLISLLGEQNGCCNSTECFIKAHNIFQELINSRQRLDGACLETYNELEKVLRKI